MKRTLIVLFAALFLILTLAVSCSDEVNVDEKVNVSFSVSDVRALSSSATFMNFDDLDWWYKATTTSTDFNYGAATNWKKLTNGLNTNLAFSQGIWAFELCAVARGTEKVTETTPMTYYGERSGVLVQKPEEGSTAIAITISVTPSSAPGSGSTGAIVISKAIDIIKATGYYSSVDANKYSIDKIGGGYSSNGSIGGSDVLVDNLTPGDYKVTVSYEERLNESTTIQRAAESIDVTVYDGSTITVKGYVFEATQAIIFNPENTYNAGVSTTAVQKEDNTFDNLELNVPVTPSMSSNVDEKTIVTVPGSVIEANAGESSSPDVSVDVTVTPVTDAASSGFSVAEGESVAAVLDLSLSIGGTSVSNFGDETPVTVSTYIAKNLTNVKVYYGTEVVAVDNEETDIYNEATGKLTFTTTHFSKFHVGADAVAYVATKNTAYATIYAAIEAVDEADTITLLRDKEMDFTTIGTKSLSIDLNEHTLSNTGTNGTTITGGTEIKFSNGKLNLTGYASTAGMLCVETQSSLILENVEYVTSGAAIYPRGDAAKVLVKNSTITATAYCVATNAAKVDNYGVEIEIIDSELSGYSPVLVNVPCTLKITGSTITGSMHGVVVRGGTAVISGSTITVQADATEDMQNYFVSRNWGSGNMVNLAALTFGNKGSGAYQYPTSVTVSNSTIKAVKGNGTTGYYPDVYPAIYGHGNSGEGLGATLTYDASTTVIGEEMVGEYATIIRPDSSQE